MRRPSSNHTAWYAVIKTMTVLLFAICNLDQKRISWARLYLIALQYLVMLPFEIPSPPTPLMDNRLVRQMNC